MTQYVTTIAGAGLFSEQIADAAHRLEALFKGHRVIEIEDAKSNSEWIRVAKFQDGTPGKIGWVKKANLKEVADLEQEFEESIFVRLVISSEFVFNNNAETKIFFSDADYMIAWAIIVSKLKNLHKDGPDGDRFGPFAILKTEWDEFIATPFAPVGLGALQFLSPLQHIHCAAYLMHAQANALSKMNLVNGVGTRDDPYLPRFGELLRCRMIGVDETFRMQNALKTNAGDQSLSEFLASGGSGFPQGKIKKLLDYWARFMRNDGLSNGDPLTLKGFHDKCAEILNKELKSALALIKQHVPEAIATPISGAAPWMDIARKELAAGVSQAGAPLRISEYFTATGTNGNAATPWCGAFVAWCLRECGGTVEASYQSIRATAAASGSWQRWGDVEINLKGKPPVGAIVVLSPSEETAAASHVGFFKSYDDEKRKVTILGGNQSNKVSEVPFKAADVIAIRWLNSLTAENLSVGSGTDKKFAALLSLIANHESQGNYNAFFGNAGNQNSPAFTSMAIRDVQAWQSTHGLKAVGKYQIIPSTLAEIVDRLDLTGSEIFDENLQDRMAINLLEKRKIAKFLQDRDVTGFGNRLAMEWAALPVLSNIQGEHRMVNRGETYYAGDGVNKALVAPNVVEDVLKQLS